MHLDEAEMRLLVHLLRQRVQRSQVQQQQRQRWQQEQEEHEQQQQSSTAVLPPKHLVFDDPLGVTASAARVLAAAIPVVTPSLQSLSLAGCGIDDDAAALAEAVPKLPRLFNMSLEENPFSPAARALLRNACRRCDVQLSAYTEVDNECFVSEWG